MRLEKKKKKKEKRKELNKRNGTCVSVCLLNKRLLSITFSLSLHPACL